VTVPGVPAVGQSCLSRINKTFDGFIASQLGSPYFCSLLGKFRVPLHSNSQTEIALRVYQKPECDETPSDVPGDFFLTASGNTIHQNTGLAHFTGQFELKDGGDGPVVFTGAMELLGRVGTHQALGEQCHETQHVEGWLVGRGLGQWSQYTLRAVVSAEASFPNGLINASPTNRITGVIVKAL
jgi:hypothetical protein